MSTYLIPKIENPFNTSVVLPGSKSIALRQLAMAALCEGESTVRGVPVCDDTAAMLDCLSALGLQISKNQDGSILLNGPMDMHADVVLNARMSGASTRLLIGLAALRHGQTTIDGHPSLQARTNEPLFEVLRAHGVDVESSSGGLPATLRGPMHAKDDIHIDGSLSSQYISAILLIAPLLAKELAKDITENSDSLTTPSNRPSVNPPIRGKVTVNIDGQLVSRPYVDITLNEMSKRGAQAQWATSDNVQTSTQIHITDQQYANGEYLVEGDATAATYFAALATLHNSTLTFTNLGHTTKQGDYAFLEVMQQLGAEVDRHENSTTIRGPKNIESLDAIDMTTMPDAALTLIALAPLLPKGAHITGLSSLHHKECDRLESPATEFAKLNIKAVTNHDSICIDALATEEVTPHTLTTYHDHRMAMAFSVLASKTGQITVDDKKVVDKTFPDYWQTYDTLRA